MPARRLLFPSERPDQGDEDAAGSFLLPDSVPLLLDGAKSLVVGAPDRDDQPSPDFQLLHQGIRDLRRPGCHDNRVKRGFLAPSLRPITHPDRNILIPQAGEQPFRPLRQLRNPFDGVHLADEFRKNRGLIAGAGSHLQNPIVRFRRSALGHHGNHVGLGYGLPLADGKRAVLVSMVVRILRNKPVPWYLFHGSQNPAAPNPSFANLVFHHPLALAFVIGHATGSPRDP